MSGHKYERKKRHDYEGELGDVTYLKATPDASTFELSRSGRPLENDYTPYNQRSGRGGIGYAPGSRGSPSEGGYSPTRYDSQPTSYDPRPRDYGSTPRDYDRRPDGYGSRPGDYNSRPRDYDSSPRDYNSRSRDYETSPRDYDSKPRDYDSSPRDYNSRPRDYETSPRDYDSKPRDYDSSPRDYNSKPRDYEPSNRDRTHGDYSPTDRTRPSDDDGCGPRKDNLGPLSAPNGLDSSGPQKNNLGPLSAPSGDLNAPFTLDGEDVPFGDDIGDLSVDAGERKPVERNFDGGKPQILDGEDIPMGDDIGDLSVDAGERKPVERNFDGGKPQLLDGGDIPMGDDIGDLSVDAGERKPVERNFDGGKPQLLDGEDIPMGDDIDDLSVDAGERKPVERNFDGGKPQLLDGEDIPMGDDIGDLSVDQDTKKPVEKDVKPAQPGIPAVDDASKKPTKDAAPAPTMDGEGIPMSDDDAGLPTVEEDMKKPVKKQFKSPDALTASDLPDEKSPKDDSSVPTIEESKKKENKDAAPIDEAPVIDDKKKPTDKKKPWEKKKDDKKPEDKKPDDKKPDDKKPGDKKPDDKKVDDKKPDDSKKKPWEKKKDEKKPDDKKPDDKKPDDKKVDDKKVDDKKPDDSKKKPGEKEKDEKKPDDKKLGDKKPDDKNLGEKKPDDKKADDKKPEDKKPDDKKPDDKKKDEKKPDDKKQDKKGGALLFDLPQDKMQALLQCIEGGELEFPELELNLEMLETIKRNITKINLEEEQNIVINFFADPKAKEPTSLKLNIKGNKCKADVSNPRDGRVKIAKVDTDQNGMPTNIHVEFTQTGKKFPLKFVFSIKEGVLSMTESDLDPDTVYLYLTAADPIRKKLNQKEKRAKEAIISINLQDGKSHDVKLKYGGGNCVADVLDDKNTDCKVTKVVKNKNGDPELVTISVLPKGCNKPMFLTFKIGPDTIDLVNIEYGGQPMPLKRNKDGSLMLEIPGLTPERIVELNLKLGPKPTDTSKVTLNFPDGKTCTATSDNNSAVTLADFKYDDKGLPESALIEVTPKDKKKPIKFDVQFKDGVPSVKVIADKPEDDGQELVVRFKLSPDDKEPCEVKMTVKDGKLTAEGDKKANVKVVSSKFDKNGEPNEIKLELIPKGKNKKSLFFTCNVKDGNLSVTQDTPAKTESSPKPKKPAEPEEQELVVRFKLDPNKDPCVVKIGILDDECAAVGDKQASAEVVDFKCLPSGEPDYIRLRLDPSDGSESIFFVLRFIDGQLSVEQEDLPPEVWFIL